MELILQAIELSRQRSASTSPDLPISEQPCVRSFVEGVLTSAIVSVESRAHHGPWLNVAKNRKAVLDSVATLLSKPVSAPSPNKRPLTTDMGWTLERLLDIICLPDTFPPFSPESTAPVVNFDKRRCVPLFFTLAGTAHLSLLFRHICYSVTGSLSLSPSLRNQRRREVDHRDYDRLRSIEREVQGVHFDLRAIKDDAYRESTQVQTTKRVQRPFQKLVSLQHEKNKRDRAARDRLSKERKLEQARNDRREDYFSKAPPSSRRQSAGPKQHRPKKSSGTFFQQLMRPISSAFSLDNVEANAGEKRTAAELDFVPSGKPALVVNIADAKVAPFTNYERSFTFQLDTEEGGHYLLQTATKSEMLKWIQVIDRVARTAAKRRLTYLGNSPKPQLADHMQDRSTAAARDPTAGMHCRLLIRCSRNN